MNNDCLSTSFCSTQRCFLSNNCQSTHDRHDSVAEAHTELPRVSLQNRSTCGISTVVTAPLFLLSLQMWWMDREMRGGEKMDVGFGGEECPDRPRHTEALTVTFVLGSGKISQQVWKPLKPFSKLAQICFWICWTPSGNVARVTCPSALNQAAVNVPLWVAEHLNTKRCWLQRV